jgi:hypothetical protein
MVHYGKHIIDPKTGLCEICDRGAIHDLRHGKRTGKQFLYSNQDGRFTYRPKNEENYHPEEIRTTPRYVRKPLYPEPPPPARPRRVVHEEPAVVHKKVVRRHHSPVEEFQHSPLPRPTTLYYVDNTGQMYPQNEGPPEEPRQHYPVQNHHSPQAARPTRVVQRRAQTPPPPASETWRAPPRRQHNSDIEFTEGQHQVKPQDYYTHPSSTAELYHIDSSHHNNGFSTISSIVQKPHDNNTPSPRIIHHGDTNKKQRQLEPIGRKYYQEPEPTVVRKVYKKLPSQKYEPRQEEYVPNDNHLRPVRKIEKIYPSPRQYESSPQLMNRHDRSPVSDRLASVYYIQSVDGY